MNDILTALGPGLGVIGWVGLLAAAFFFVMVSYERRQHALWRSASYEPVVLEGQPCLLWTGHDGVLNCQPSEDPHGVPDSGVVYYKPGNRGQWQLDEPESHVLLFTVLAWSSAAFGVLCNVLRQLAVAL
ncbi:hypothetical protein [Paeniglutamicibacter cryotolerans]|uniref:DUF3592 domain-containing protein n=1 Tax=Paeniglutamicibacter cryotolerans TaxID=670079 RepID=A0A839QRL6_9MICC|nr:hypothetical protein [Paeniglutamicibacter cryotolerans]MBB2994711.1 hypothetical protein [Paeniglutamicibacter cryotolerans]